MSPRPTKTTDPAALRSAMVEVWPWARDPQDVPRPSRSVVAAAVRLSVAQLEQDAPGHSVEVRVPPFAAAQCVEGSVHRRGTPPNVVQCDALTWLRLAGGLIDLDGAVAAGAEVSGAHAGDVSHWLPVVRGV
ncbi:MAG: sterol carrier family protein [Corynebacterium sp.]|uniref:sterol carrier family protein n=1 Tax=unclassified Corynebacterium TaxID=2624378 RepID=UPI002647502D|nr:sterol carrier family protein [Corynebacterium sp.]MDN5582892.1 sterol carrier family protein [Corynebacterium sp.]MDN5720698.1 sterol carrier family protein [Corynebacterium sp.]MDN6325931.1 sterol carrier family protein [Corynebacterium sp.]MDN6386938.1 sterol carrier family protein [Corynebacterium sp.]MDN6510539.1 sterol carrier family protein [Corynebacterium sp.]